MNKWIGGVINKAATATCHVIIDRGKENTIAPITKSI